MKTETDLTDFAPVRGSQVSLVWSGRKIRMKQETFIHRFSDTVQCEITITADPPTKGKNHVRNYVQLQ